jgi:hypothetical protein
MRGVCVLLCVCVCVCMCFFSLSLSVHVRLFAPRTRFSSLLTLAGIEVSHRLMDSIRRLDELIRDGQMHPDDLDQFGYASPYTQAQMTDVQKYGVRVKHMMLMQRSSSAALYLRSSSIGR